MLIEELETPINALNKEGLTPTDILESHSMNNPDKFFLLEKMLRSSGGKKKSELTNINSTIDPLNEKLREEKMEDDEVEENRLNEFAEDNKVMDQGVVQRSDMERKGELHENRRPGRQSFTIKMGTRRCT